MIPPFDIVPSPEPSWEDHPNTKVSHAIGTCLVNRGIQHGDRVYIDPDMAPTDNCLVAAVAVRADGTPAHWLKVYRTDGRDSWLETDGEGANAPHRVPCRGFLVYGVIWCRQRTLPAPPVFGVPIEAMLAARASAGGGTDRPRLPRPLALVPAWPLAWPTDRGGYAVEVTGDTPPRDKALVWKVPDDAMAPDIREGDTLIIDTRIQHPQDGEVVVLKLRLTGEWLVRRWYFAPHQALGQGTRLLFVADAPGYPPLPITHNPYEFGGPQFEVVGGVYALYRPAARVYAVRRGE